MVYGRVFVNYWTGVLTSGDVTRTYLEAKAASVRRGALAGIGILGADLQRPGIEVVKKMHAEHVEMRKHHDSIHLVPLMQSPFLLSSIRSLVTLGFYTGTGGKLFYHDSVREALIKAEEYGPLQMSANDILGQLDREKIPVGKPKT
jgi:hypothetical protein